MSFLCLPQTQEGGGKPQVETIVVKILRIQDVVVQPIQYFTVCCPFWGTALATGVYHRLQLHSSSSLKLLEGLVVLGVIRHEPHPTHMNVEQALKLTHQVQAKRTYFTHISHLLEHEEAAALPDGVSLARRINCWV